MLKKMLYRKIVVATSLLIVLLMLYLLPENNTIKFKETNISYSYSNKLKPVFLLDSNNYISRVMIPISSSSKTDIAYEMIEILTIGGKYEDKLKNGFRSLIPSIVNVKSIKIDNNILTIDFSKEFLTIKEETIEKILEAIIYTITGINGIDKINILVDGKQLTNMPESHKAIPEILDRSYGINKEYELVSMNDINNYIVYYVNKNNNDIYYVPVTKYVNDDKKDKIKVIISELASSYITETNLSSYLSSDIKLLDYEIVDDTIKLNFSNDIFSDITTNNILEEVIYTISLSIMDNIPVSDVIFIVNDEIVCKSSSIIY